MIVAAVGLVLSCVAILLRFAIFNVASYKFLAMLSTFGREKTGNWGSPSVQVSYQVLSTVFMTLFFVGVALMLTATLAWLFTPPRKDDHAD